MANIQTNKQMAALTQIRKSGIMDNLTIGLCAYFTVATGARAKNILILLASSGMVENAMKARKKKKRIGTHSIMNPRTTYNICHTLAVWYGLLAVCCPGCN